MPDSPVEIRWKKSQSRRFRTPQRCGSVQFSEDKGARYDVGDQIAKTKSSEVSKGYDTKHRYRPVIIKQPFEDTIFKSEIAALTRLHDHKNIISLLDFYTLDDASHRLIYEYVPGQDLIDWTNEYYLDPHSEHDIETTMKPIAEQLLQALLFCHEHGVAHRDVKLDNIRINPLTGEIKLLDFGFAYVEDSKMNHGLRCGSHDYAPPEIISPEDWEENSVDPFKSDVWSYGVVVYILTHYQIPYYMNKRYKFVLDKPEKRFSKPLRHLLKQVLKEDVKERPDMKTVKDLLSY